MEVINTGAFATKCNIAIKVPRIYLAISLLNPVDQSFRELSPPNPFLRAYPITPRGKRRVLPWSSARDRQNFHSNVSSRGDNQCRGLDNSLKALQQLFVTSQPDCLYGSLDLSLSSPVMPRF